MASRKSDVVINIRAVDETTKAVDTISNGIEKLLRQLQQGGSQGADFAKGLAAIDKAYASLAGTANTSSANFQRVTSEIAKQRDTLANYQKQVESATAAQRRLSSPDAVIGAGRDQSGRIAQLKAASAEVERLQKEMAALARSIATQERAVGGSTSSLQFIGSSASSAEKLIASFRAEMERLTAAQDRQASSAAKAASARSQAAAAQQFYNNSAAPGLNSQRLTGTARQDYERELSRTFAPVAQREEAAALSKQLNDAAAAHRAFEERVKAGAAAMKQEAAEAARLQEAADMRNATAAHRMFEERVRAGVKALEDEAAAAKRTQTAAQRIRDALNPTGAITRGYNDQIREAIALRRQEAISADEVRKRILQLRDASREAVKAQQAAGDNKKLGFLGLKPYELQNLSYQINDIFTQLGSGTSLTQTLSQQGGQIFQLFQNKIPKAIGVGTAVPIAATVAALAGLAVVISRVVSNASQLREISAVLEGNADAANYSATQLQATVKAMREFGISAEDAMKVVRVAIQRGLSQDLILSFGKAAKGLSVILGGDVVNSAQQLSTALTGDYQALLNLNKQTNAFTADQLKLIRGLLEQGRTTEAVSRATDILIPKLGQVADAAEGDAQKAVRQLTVAWNELLDSFANNKWIQAAVGGLAIVAQAAAKTARVLGGIQNLQDKKDNLQSILDTPGGFLGTSGTLRERSIATNRGLIPAPGFENDSATLKQINAANQLMNEIAATERRVADEQRDAASQREQAAVQEVKSATELLATTKKIRSEDDVRNALAAERKRLNLEASQRFPGTGKDLDAARQDYVNAQLAQRSLQLNEQLAGYKKSQADDAKRAADEEERALKGYVSRVVAAETGGSRNPNTAKNPNSSATGMGQFISSTWIDLVRRHLPDAKGMTDAAILELRKNADLSKQMIEVYARENAANLKRAGISITEANLQLAHFLGVGDAKKVIKAAPDTPLQGLISSASIRANPTILGGGRTAGDAMAYARRRAGVNADNTPNEALRAEQDAQIALDKIEGDRLKKQQDFNDELSKEARSRQQNTDLANQQRGLSGEALIDAQREAEVQKAISAAREKAAKDNLRFTEAQAAAIRQQVEQEYEATRGIEARAAARRAAVDNPVSDLTGQRDSLQSRIQFFAQTGNTGMVGELQPQLDKINASLATAIQNAIAFYQALKPGEDPTLATQAGIDTVVNKLKAAQEQTVQWNSYLGISGEQIANVFASQASSALDSFAQSIAEGKNAFKSLWDSFRQFAANFLRQIAQMIQQQLIFNLISGLLQAGTGAATGGASASGSTSAFAGIKAHSGGVIGDASTYGRNTGATLVNPSWFANARRYHTGGIAGLAANEVPAVLQRGEEVLTASDPRHRNNGGMGGGGSPNIKIVNAVDGGELMSQALNTSVGEKAFTNYLRNNAGSIKSILG